MCSSALHRKLSHHSARLRWSDCGYYLDNPSATSPREYPNRSERAQNLNQDATILPRASSSCPVVEKAVLRDKSRWTNHSFENRMRCASASWLPMRYSIWTNLCWLKYLDLCSVRNILPMSTPAHSVTQSASSIGCIAKRRTVSRRYPTTLKWGWKRGSWKKLLKERSMVIKRL